MLRTNFTKDQLSAYKKSIEEYYKRTNSNRLSISEKAYSNTGMLIPGLYALHDSSDEDLSLFWVIYKAACCKAGECKEDINRCRCT